MEPLSQCHWTQGVEDSALYLSQESFLAWWGPQLNQIRNTTRRGSGSGQKILCHSFWIWENCLWFQKGKSLHVPRHNLMLPNQHMLTSFSPRWCCREEGPTSVRSSCVTKCSIKGGSSQKISLWACSSVAEVVWLAQHGYLLLCFYDMLPFQQLCVNLFGTCCSLAKDPEAFTMLIYFPLCPQPLPFRGERPWIRSNGMAWHCFHLESQESLSLASVTLFSTFYSPVRAWAPQ